MEVNEQNDEEMILVVVGDDDAFVKYETSESPEPEVPVPGRAKIKPRHFYGAEDVKEIFPTAAEHEVFVKSEPDVEELDEEYLSQEEYLEEELPQDIVDTKNIKTEHVKVPKNKRRKTKVVSPKKSKRKTKATPKVKPKSKNPQKKVGNVQRKKQQPVAEEHFIEIEFLEDDIVAHEVPVLKKDSIKIEYLDDPPKKTKRKTNVSPKKLVPKKEEDDEYIPEEVDQDDDEYIPKEEDQEDDGEDFIEDEYFPPKGNRKSKTLSRTPARATPKAQSKKAEKPNSFILELCEEQPHLQENEEDLVEYLVDYMRKRRPPSPPPDYYYLTDDNMYRCSYCDISKPTEAAAGRHYQAAHGSRYLVCLACGSGFRSTVILYKHEKICAGPGAVVQLRARGVFLGRKGRGRPFLTKNKFIPKEPPPGKPPPRVHVPNAEKTKYYCTDCPAYFTREILLEEHMHKHTGFRAFQCHECPAAYVSRYQLTKHSKKHNDEQFICDHCGKVFKLKTTLALHLNTHLPRPRFGCGRCGRRYAKRDAVRSHIMRVHMNLPPPALCPVCPKRYNRMSHVKVHMKRDHGLTLMTKRSMERNLPYMKIEDLEGAKIVFNKNENIEILDLNSTLNEQILG